MTSRIKSTIKEENGTSPVLFQHPRLIFAYPIVDVAKIAASFRNIDLGKRLDSAIDLLAMIEQMQLLPPETKIRNESRKLRGSAVDALSQVELKNLEDGYKRRQQNPLRCNKILSVCERGEKSGKIKRSSLIAEVSKDVNGTASPNYDADVFNEWLDSMKEKSPTGDPKSLGIHGFRYESARRVKLIPDDDAAFHLITGFRSWLQKRKRGNSILRSKTTKTIVSQKDKGAARMEDGTYSKK